MGLDLMDHKSRLSLGCSSSYRLGNLVVPGLKPDVRQRLPFFQWFSLSYWVQGGSQVSGAEALNVRPDLAVFPQICMLPSPSTATLAKEGHKGPVHVGKRSQSTGWLLTEVPATSNVPPVPAPEVASPTLLKHSFWSETPWSLTADQFPQPLPPLPY